jgi:hypothetical protein
MSNYMRSTIVSPLVPYSFTGAKASYSAANDGATAQLGFRFNAVTTSPITHVAWYQDVTGTMTGITYIAEIQTDSGGGIPSGTVLGAGTGATAYRTSDGWSAEIALGTNTGTLTTGVTSYWLVIRDGGGTNPTGSNNAKLQTWGGCLAFGQVRKFNGTNWTANVLGRDGVFYCLHADGKVTGYPITSTFAVTALGSVAGKMYGTSGYGFKMQFAQNQTIDAVSFRMVLSGSPGDITMVLADAAGTTIESVTVDEDLFIDDDRNLITFAAPHVMPGGTDFYVVFSCTGNSSNYYTPYTVGVNSTYISQIAGSMRFLTGDSASPTAMTVETAEIPVAVGVLSFNGPAGGTTGKLASFNAGFN